MPIKYVTGDATRPQGPGPKIIVHSVNDLGAWGMGFVLALSKRWPEPEAMYVGSLTKGAPVLGSVQFVPVTDTITVANLVGQKGLISPTNNTPVKYSAMRTGLERVASKAKEMKATIHMPRMGCGLGGGTWDKMEPIISETCKGIDVVVYDLK